MVLTAALAVLLSGCEWLRPFEEVCENRLGPTIIDVVATPISHGVDLGKSTAELTAMGAPSTGRQVLGLTQTSLKWSASYGSRGLTRRPGSRHCMRPAISVKLSFEPMTVFVGREQAEGSCAFNITMDHERRHVRVYERFLDEVAPRMQAALAAHFGNRIFYFDSEAEAERHVQASLRDFLAPLVDNSMKDVAQRQAAVDTPEEYFRLDGFQQACSS